MGAYGGGTDWTVEDAGCLDAADTSQRGNESHGAPVDLGRVPVQAFAQLRDGAILILAQVSSKRIGRRGSANFCSRFQRRRRRAGAVPPSAHSLNE